MVYNWLQKAQGLLYPSRCLLCDAPGMDGLDLCAGCYGDLPWLRRTCRHCALPLPETASVDSCAACSRRPPPIEHAVGALAYEPPAAWLITQLKFHARTHHARLLADLMAAALATNSVNDDVPQALVPVPLHPGRLRERGFNQAAEIAGRLAAQLGMPVDARCCRRIRATAHQTELPADQRRRNIRGAFAASERVVGRHLVIVDDVVTTGNTVFELARCLRRAGAGRVDLWCTARA